MCSTKTGLLIFLFVIFGLLIIRFLFQTFHFSYVENFDAVPQVATVPQVTTTVPQVTTTVPQVATVPQVVAAPKVVAAAPKVAAAVPQVAAASETLTTVQITD